MTDIILPELGEGILKATVACWHKTPGEKVSAGDEVCEVVTDKAVFSVDAPNGGILRSIVVPQGQDVLAGGVLGTIE